MKSKQKKSTNLLKEQYSQTFTLKSIRSEQQYLQIVPTYNKNQNKKQYRSGHWSAKQHVKYIMFLQYFCDLFLLPHNKKLWKIFTLMSAFIRTRNSSQCRSHHQKTQKKYTTTSEVLKFQKIRYKNYDTQYQKIKKILKALPINTPQQMCGQKQVQKIGSVKILEQNQEYPTFNNNFSVRQLANLRINSSTSIIPSGSIRNPVQKGSNKFLIANSINKILQKPIKSSCSIQMQDQNKEKQPIYGLIPQEVQFINKKNENNIPTADSYKQQPARSSKKARSVLPSFNNQLDSELTQKNKKNHKVDDPKCRTSKANSSQDQQQSWSVLNNGNSIKNSKSIGNSAWISSASKSVQYPDDMQIDFYPPFLKKDQQNLKDSYYLAKKNEKTNNLLFCDDYKLDVVLSVSNRSSNPSSNLSDGSVKMIQKPQQAEGYKKSMRRLTLPDQMHQKKNQQQILPHFQHFSNRIIAQQMQPVYMQSAHIQPAQIQPLDVQPVEDIQYVPVQNMISYYNAYNYYPNNHLMYQDYYYFNPNMYYQMKDWVEFYIYFWLWKLKMNEFISKNTPN